MNEKAILAGGCFWCTEAIFKRLKGVYKVTPGYSGGNIDNPTYEQISSGNTGHAEAIEIEFDPKQITYEDLLFVFFKTHDPTAMDQQGADQGTQYRSIVFYTTEVQKETAEKTISRLQKDYDKPIVTQIKKFESFFEAEDYHKDFYDKNREYGYCKLVVDPKIEKLKKNFKDKLA